MDSETHANQTIELAACPFCGKNLADLLEEDIEEVKMYSLYCPVNKGGCGSSTGYYINPVDAVRAWNHRIYKSN